MPEEYIIVPNTEQDSDAVHDSLREYNRRYMRGLRDYSFHIEADGTMIAGVVAGSVFDTLEIEFLFVEERYRGRGLGRRLIRQVEECAKADGLRRMILNTYSFQAPGFYEKLGFRKLYALDPCFGEYSQHFFCKEL